MISQRSKGFLLFNFHGIPIRKKLTIIAMVPITLALLLAGFAFILFDEISLHRSMANEITMLSQMIGANNSAALVFGDPKSSEENLAVLAANVHVVAGCIYTTSGSVFATYVRNDYRTKFTPPAIQKDGHRFGNGYLTRYTTIQHNGTTVGTLFLQYDLKSLTTRRYGYLAVAFMVLLTAIGVALITLAWFSRAISEPLARLASIARTVSQEKNYTVRAETQNRDEIGELVNGFNEMLEQVQERDTRISHYSEELESQVTVRTSELKEANLSLQTQIAERERIEEELFRTRQLESLGILAGGIAHDFNNILTAILGNVSIAMTKVSQDNKLYENLESVEKACFRAVDLTQQLLTFSKGGVPVKKITSIADAICDTARFVFRGSKSKCHFMVSNDLWTVAVDQGQISQVIHNLAINAEQALPDGGDVWISADNLMLDDRNELSLAPGRYIRITVKDNGTGIAAELLPRIFTPYFTTKEKGSGLGLATSYSIISKHNGLLKVSSESRSGTTFNIYLPAASEKQPLKTATEPAATDVDRTVQGRILVMDDEQLVRDVTMEMLTHIGYSVDHAADGSVAIEKYLAARAAGAGYDLVIMDLTIPGGMGGETAIKKLLELDPNVRAIAASGYSDGPVMAEYERFGFKGCITKPFRLNELSSLTQRILQ